MRLHAAVVAAVLVSPLAGATAAPAPDPLYGNDAQARAVLDCHASYARRMATALVDTQITATEIATAAHAHCIGALQQYASAATKAAVENGNAAALVEPARYQQEMAARMRDYAFAYALDAYLASKATP